MNGDDGCSEEALAELLHEARPSLMRWHSRIIAAVKRRVRTFLLCGRSLRSPTDDEVAAALLLELEELPTGQQLAQVARDCSVRVRLVDDADIEAAAGGGCFEALTTFHGASVRWFRSGAHASVLLRWPPRAGAAQSHSFSHGHAFALEVVLRHREGGDARLSHQGSTQSASSSSTAVLGNTRHDVVQSDANPAKEVIVTAPDLSVSIRVATNTCTNESSTDKSTRAHQHSHRHCHSFVVHTKNSTQLDASDTLVEDAGCHLHSSGSADDPTDYVHWHEHSHVHELEVEWRGEGHVPILCYLGATTSTATRSSPPACGDVAKEDRIAAALPILAMELANVAHRQRFEVAAKAAFSGLNLWRLALARPRRKEVAELCAQRGVELAQHCEEAEYQGLRLAAQVAEELGQHSSSSRPVFTDARYRSVPQAWPDFLSYWRHVSASSHAMHYCNWFSEELALQWMHELLSAAAAVLVVTGFAAALRRGRLFGPPRARL